ncbi:ABC-type polysaccharide/polyol phosphate transport system, ATPase component [Hahella chejuensis KCTC 2396]|uniref:ABC-type polysaccharide/polyol phosphate transport system, ATPase component n=2 Tax=Hahella chejuensis TaxID=158327 RepID=Q2SJW6_HAHCH|nr:ABC-type polysaccharide/polyol phosphate transport system, ATPase component [Hahella chejuensis KCTC 2396]
MSFSSNSTVSNDELKADDTAICIRNLSKCYQIYESPRDRLKQFVIPRLKRFTRQPPERYYREFWALRDVSFNIKRGETVGIVGRNGSGKSTLLQIICGTLSPTEGTVEINGRIAALLELGAGFNPEFTGRENVYLNAAVLGLSQSEVDERFDDIAAFADIGQFIDQPVKTYSSGMVVRLAFAVAINVDPEILVIDEALSVGDELFQRKCFSRIEAIRDSGATILFVSHSGGTVVELCDRAVLMDSGERLAVGKPKQIIGSYQKLLYAPEDKRESIRNQLLQANEIMSERVDDVAGLSQNNKMQEKEYERLQENFDPHLKPVSTIEYESRGATIESLKILTLNGEPVNGLVRGRKYRYCYSVRFDVAASNVRFGMLLKTTSGLELGGSISAPSLAESIPFIPQGKVVSVEFTFHCYLNPGVYFMNAGVLAVCGQEETFLHRKIDAIAFRVLPETSSTATEIVDFCCTPLVSIDE